jgi:hypothetical protein
MDDTQHQELQRLIDEAPLGAPAKPTKLKNPTDPSTHVSNEDDKTGKWILFFLIRLSIYT